MNIGIDTRMIAHSGIGVRLQHLLCCFSPDTNHKFYLFGDPDQLEKYDISFPYELVPPRANR
ncbi:MAG: hypothetical protein AAF518_25850 [Spirochaetota bacterium]